MNKHFAAGVIASPFIAAGFAGAGWVGLRTLDAYDRFTRRHFHNIPFHPDQVPPRSALFAGAAAISNTIRIGTFGRWTIAAVRFAGEDETSRAIQKDVAAYAEAVIRQAQDNATA